MGRRTNYGYEKRQKELKRQKKKEMKRLKKQGKLSPTGLEPGIPVWDESSFKASKDAAPTAPAKEAPAKEAPAKEAPAEASAEESK